MRSNRAPYVMSLVAAVLCPVAVAGVADGAVLFNENFGGNTSGPNMTVGTGFGSPTTSFASGDFRITSGTSSRVYLGTNNTDYATTSFVFEADVTKPVFADTTNGAWGIIFFGMGTANAAGAPSGEPINGSDLLMVLRSDNANIESRDNASAASGTVVSSGGFVPFGTAGTFGMRMTWNAGTGSALFEFDRENDGAYNGASDRNFTLNGADNAFTASNSQLILGGGNGLAFDNVSVVPEPASVVLLAGVPLLFVRRRRPSH